VQKRIVFGALAWVLLALAVGTSAAEKMLIAEWKFDEGEGTHAGDTAGRNHAGRAFVSRSTDDGATWSAPEPAALAASNSPIIVRCTPGTDDLLTIWNQASNEEIRNGHARCRLSAAISKDKGVTWEHFRNLESQDTRTYVEREPPAQEPVKKREDIRMCSLTQEETEHELTGSKYVNCSYPAILFFDGLALVTYDAGGYDVESGLKLRRVPIEWFYDA